MRYAQFEDHKGPKDEIVAFGTSEEFQIIVQAMEEFCKANPRKSKAKAVLKKMLTDCPAFG